MKKALISGAGGFLGSALSKQLLKKNIEVRGIARNSYPEMEKAGVEMFQVDIADYDAVKKAAEGCDIIFHTASKAGVWGTYKDYYRTNVTGTENIIKVCRELNISKLVYTSTPSVTFKGRDEDGVDEKNPHAQKFLCHYAATKSIAEKLALAADDETLSVCALRPHLIWGPGDPHLVPRIIKRAQKGKLRLIGKGDKNVDITYIDNAAAAHVLAGEHLAPDAVCAGKAYYISNDQPMAMSEIINRILNAGGLPPAAKSISVGSAYIIGSGIEMIYRLLRIKKEPLLTRFVVRQLSTAHWYNIEAAKNDLGYRPEVSIDEGMELLKKSLM